MLHLIVDVLGMALFIAIYAYALSTCEQPLSGGLPRPPRRRRAAPAFALTPVLQGCKAS